MMPKISWMAFICLCLWGFYSKAQEKPGHPKREFRGVWVATVENIDWPSKPGMSSDAQKAELIGILENHKQQGFNAVMLQIRPAGDALYAKSREPWSKWLTGRQGIAPSPGYDPLEFAIKEAHFRGMELHAWFNPYRASLDGKPLSEGHMYTKKPEWFFTYANHKQFNPGLPEVRNYIIDVVLDVVREYDIDGVHMDDYFYPYPVAGQKLNDEDTYHQFGQGFTNIADWRRNNVDQLIEGLYKAVHKEKNWVKVGISPSSIWKNKSQDTLGSQTYGLSTYNELYANTRKWVQEGWVDYINPQIYFSFTRRAAPFGELLNWWSNNTFNRHLYVGQAAYLVNTKSDAAWRQADQLPRQIREIRNNTRAQGSVFFSSASMRTVARAVADSLRNDFYRYPSLPPVMTWLDDVPPNAPRRLEMKFTSIGIELRWQTPYKARDGETAYGYVIYRCPKGQRPDIADAKNIYRVVYDSTPYFLDTDLRNFGNYQYVVTAIDRLKNESQPSNAVQ